MPDNSSMTTPSREGRTLQDVLAALDARNDLSAAKRRDLKSAVRRAAKLLAHGDLQISADPREISKRLADFSPAMAGLKRSSFNNFKSLLRRALQLTGCLSHPGRHQTGLTEDWRTLMARFAYRKQGRGISRFAHFCSCQGWEPGGIEQDHFERFLCVLEHDALIANPKQVYLRTCNTWNRASKMIAGWPQFQVVLPISNRSHYTLPWETFSQILRDQVDAYLADLACDDPLASTNTRPLAPRTLELRRFQLLQVLSALVHRGHRPEDLTSLSIVAEPHNLAEALRFFYERADKKVSVQMDGLATMVITMAKHWLQFDETKLDQLQQLTRKVRHKQKGLSDKNRIRLLQFDDPSNVDALLTLPEWLLREAKKSRQKKLYAARLVRTALAVELLLMTALRAGNLLTLHLDQHIKKATAGPNGRVHLVIPAEEVKNGKPLEFTLPDSTVRMLNIYISEYRPTLAPPNCRWLFPNKRGGHLSTRSFWSTLRSVVRRYTGLTVNPHLFRHIGSKIFLSAHPGSYEVMRRTLAHSSLDTTTTFYTGLETGEATKLYYQNVLKLRKDAQDRLRRGVRRRR